jgi:biopolymer transport protein ExbD
MHFSSGRTRRVALDMTPLIDVVLMLVIFFMLTTTFVLAPGIKVDLPQGQAVQQPHDRDAVIVITHDGTVYYQDTQVELAALRVRLQERVRQQPAVRVVIKADKQAQHGRVVAVMDMAKTLGIEKLAIATAPPPAGPQ